MTTPMENPADYSASEAIALSVPEDSGGRRLDQVLADLLPQYSRNRLQSWIKSGLVSVDGRVEVEPKHKLRGREVLLLEEDESAAPVLAQAEDIPLSVVFEDDALLVINKPAGLVVHPGNGNWQGTLLNALLHHAPSLEGVPRAGIVHRLDKETSGLLVVGKTLTAQTDLVRQLQARSVKRLYLAVAQGNIKPEGRVDAPIGRHPVSRIRMAVVPGGKPAVTYYKVVERFGHCALVECTLETGRTHQIRVHLASLAHPLLGDPVYGKVDSRLPRFGRQALHAYRLGLVHPVTGQRMQWEAPLPLDMNGLLEQLRHG